MDRTKSVLALCHEYRISHKTGFKWLARFRQEGLPGLRDRARRPRKSPRRTSARWLDLVRELRRKYPTWGAKKIFAVLTRRYPRACPPQVRTISKWLRHWGLTRKRRCRARPGPRVPGSSLTQPHAPNDVWTVDFKGWFRTLDGQRVDPLTVRDLYSRMILGIFLTQSTEPAVRRCFTRLFRAYGLPKVIRVDHGVPFAGDGALDLSTLSVWWWRLGIKVEFTRRAAPQENGAHEQMHKIYKAELASPPADNPQSQRRKQKQWIEHYNHERPHEGLGQKFPADFYRKSRRSCPAVLPTVKYPRTWSTLRPAKRGYAQWRGRRRFIGRAFGQQLLGLKPMDARTVQVHLGSLLIGELVESDLAGMRPARYVSEHPDHPNESNKTHSPMSMP
jgi:putative transposase